MEQAQPLRMRATTYKDQRIVVRFDGQDVTTLQGTGETPQVFEIDLPADVVGKRNTLQLALPDAKSPVSLQEGDDQRVLGVGVEWIEFAPVAR